jgi:hypothetical protein
MRGMRTVDFNANVRRDEPSLILRLVDACVIGDIDSRRAVPDLSNVSPD